MIVKTHSVFCDRCPNWVAEVVDNQGGTKEARRIARAAGWKRVQGEDICPRCQPTTPAASPQSTVATGH